MQEVDILKLYSYLVFLSDEIKRWDNVPDNQAIHETDYRRLTDFFSGVVADHPYLLSTNTVLFSHWLNIAVRLGDRQYTSVTALRMQLSDFKSDILLYLNGVKFAFIPENRAEYAENKSLFGPSVAESFPSAGVDIKEAGNCFAAGSFTAAVFHLMRAAEVALRTLSRDLQISFPNGPIEYQEWGIIINTMQTVAESRCEKLKGKKARSEAREFYHGAMGEFRAFKDAWRNHVMHSRDVYDEQTTLSVLNHVREFMQRLAKKLKEGRKKPIRWD